MSSKTRFFKSFWLLILSIPMALFITACESNQDCNEILDTPVNIKFKLKIEGSEDKYKDTTLTRLSAYIAGQPEILFADTVTQSNLQLLLNPNEDSCSIVLSLPISVVPPPGGDDFLIIYDTLSFTYKRSTKFVSVECGFIMQYDLLKTYHTGRFFEKIDSINFQVTNDFKTHLEIVVLPATLIEP